MARKLTFIHDHILPYRKSWISDRVRIPDETPQHYVVNDEDGSELIRFRHD